jgi:hypothetical protein
MVVLDRADGVVEIESIGGHVDRFPPVLESQLVCRASRLRGILPAAEIEREGANQIGISSQIHRRLSRQQPHGGAVDAPGKCHRDALLPGHRGQPCLGGVVRRRHIDGTGFIEVGRALPDRRLEESAIARRRIGASDLIHFDQVMRRHHAGVRRIELPADPLRLTPVEDSIDSIRHDQERPVIHLRYEVAQRQTDRTRQAHGHLVSTDTGEMPVGCRQRRDVAAAYGIADRSLRHPAQTRRTQTNQIDDSIDTFEHHGLRRQSIKDELRNRRVVPIDDGVSAAARG